MDNLKPRKDKPFLTLLDPELHAALTEAARTEGISMGEVMRDALRAYLVSTGPVSIAVHFGGDDGADEPLTA